MSRLHFKRIAARAMRKQCVIHKDDRCTHLGAQTPSMQSVWPQEQLLPSCNTKNLIDVALLERL